MRIVLTTVDDTDRATALARSLVEEQLAACVNIVPGIRSIYLWHNEIEDEAELLLVIKTTAGLIDALRSRLADLHPYDVPEIVVIEPESVSIPYLNWVMESLETGKGKR